MFTTARSGFASLLRSCATTATGFCPTAKFVCANVVDVTVPPIVVPPRLVESSDKVTGYRCPTKNVAGLPSCARIKISRPLFTSDNPSENFADAFGIVSRNVLFPPPTGNTSVGLAVIPRAVKTCDINVSRLVKFVAASSFATSLEFSGNACTFEGGVIPKVRALFRSTSSSSISSMTSRRACSNSLISCPASFTLSAVSRSVRLWFFVSMLMRVEFVISRITRKSSVTSSGATALSSRNVCSTSSEYSLRFAIVSDATKINVEFTTR